MINPSGAASCSKPAGLRSRQPGFRAAWSLHAFKLHASAIITSSSRRCHAPPCRARQGSEQPAAAASTYEEVLERLDQLTYGEVQKQLTAIGLPAVGKKKELLQRLAEATLAAEASAGAGGEAADVEAGDEETPADDAAFDDMEPLDPETLRAELAQLSPEEITDALANCQMSTQGSMPELIERLAQYMEDDWRREDEERRRAAGLTPVTVQDGALQLTPDQEAFLLERRAADAYELAIQSSRQELYHELKESVAPGTHVAYTARDNLAQQLSYIRAGETLQKQLTDQKQWRKLQEELVEMPPPGSEATEPLYSEAEHKPLGGVTGFNNCGVTLTEENADRDTLLSMTITQIKKLKLDEVRVGLKVFGEKADVGNRYKLMEQLMHVTALQQVTGKKAYDSISQAVSGMQLRVLRTQLSARGLDATGSRTALEARLQAVLEQEQYEGDAEKQAEEGRLQGPTLLEPLSATTRLLAQDPNITVAILFGAPSGGLDDLQASLDAARCASLGLHTAWPPLATPQHQQQQQDTTTTAPQEEEEKPADGIKARLLYVARDLSVTEMPASALQGITAAELLAGAPLLLPGGGAFSAHSGQDGLKQALAAGAAGGGGGGEVAAVMSLLLLAGMAASQAEELNGLLQGVAGPPVLGPSTLPATRTNKLALSRMLRQEGFPVLPALTLLPSDLATPAASKKWGSSLEAWTDKQGFHPERQVFMVKPALGSGGHGVVPCRGLEQACDTAQELLRAQLELQGASPSSTASRDEQALYAVLIEPYMSDVAMQFTVTVLDGVDGPVALMPTEVEITDIDTQIFESEIKHQERQLMQAGCSPEELAERVEQMRSQSMHTDAPLMVHHHRKPYPFTSMVKYHHPPRLPRKQVHALRHGAALAYQKLGLKGGARVDGWITMEPGWQDKYARVDDGKGRLLWDADPEIVQRMQEEAKQKEQSEGLPLSDYMTSSGVSLAKFNPRLRLSAQHNHEATVFFTDINPGLELDPAAPVFLQAAELGMSHAATLRNLLNAGLRQAAAQPAQPAAAPAAGPKGRRRSASASPAPEEVSPAVQLSAPPAVDPVQLSLLFFSRPDELDILQSITELRETQWLMKAEDDRDYALALEMAEEQEEVATHPAELPLQADGQVDQDMLPYVLGDDWDTEYDSRPPDSLTPEDVDAVEGAARQEQQGELLNELRQSYPGLPEAQLMYVRLGRGPDGRVIDTDLLKAKLDELHANDLGHLAGDALDECLIDPETGMVGEPFIEATGHEFEPGGYRGAQYQVSEAVAEAFQAREDSLANARSKAVRKVWLLVGGTPEGTDSALRAARDVAMQLGACADLQVELFLITPGVGVRNEEEVRSTLLARRTEWLSSGFPDDTLAEEMELDNVRNSVPVEVQTHIELVWALPMAQALQHSAASSSWAAEVALSRQGIAFHALPPLDQQALQASREVQQEAQAAGLGGVAGAWGDAVGVLPIPPRCLALEDLCMEAANEGAVVVPLLRGGFIAPIIQQLQDFGVMYTGSGPVAATQCANKLFSSQAVMSLGEESGCTTTPSQMLVGMALTESAEDVGFCAVLVEELRSALIPGYTTPGADQLVQAGADVRLPPLCVRPSHGAEGVAVARIDCAQDLSLFGLALDYGVQALPANTLSTPHRPIPMPRHVPESFIFTPWVDTDTITVTPSPTPGAPPVVEVLEATNWVEATICLLGGLGTMEPMGLSVLAHTDPHMPGVAPAPVFVPPRPAEPAVTAAAQAAASPEPVAAAADAASEEDAPATAGKKKRAASKRRSSTPSAEGSSPPPADDTTTSLLAPPATTGPQEDVSQPAAQEAVRAAVPLYLTPAPESVLSRDIASVAMAHARDAVDLLGAHGLVRLDAFVARDTGEIVVIEVDACPSLAQGSVVYQQALQRPDGALVPAALLRTLINLGLSARRDELEKELGAASLDLLGEEDDGLTLDEGQAADLAEFDDSVVEAGPEDMMEDLAAMQGSVLNATPSMVGQNDANELYLSSTGRGARRGRPARRQAGGDDDFDDSAVGVGSAGARPRSFALGDSDFDFDGQALGQAPEDPDFQDNWSLH